MRNEIKEQSMFSMDDVNRIIKMPLDEAKAEALKIVQNSKANSTNKGKAVIAIGKAMTVVTIAKTMSNYILAHPSNDLKVI